MAKINISGLPTTRQEAINIGCCHYFTGIPCPRGHVDRRAVINRICLTCNRENTKKYYRKNRKSKKFMKDCAARSLKKRNQGGEEFKKKRREYILEYRKNNVRKIQEYTQRYGKNWRKKNRSVLTIKERLKYKKDRQFKLKIILRKRLYAAIRYKCKKGSAVKLLGCSIKDFIKYFETLFTEGMSWDNHGEWEIDHIYPLSKFDLEDPSQLAIACHYKNLQPLWKIDNQKKRDKIIVEIPT